MPDEEPAQAAPDQVDGLNIPAAIEALLADVTDLKARLTVAEAEIITLKGA